MNTFAEINKADSKQDTANIFFGSSKNNKPFIQPKLTINQPNDVYEQEADAMADKVMRMEQPGVQLKQLPISSVQRKCEHCEEEEKKMQRKEINGKETAAGSNFENYVGSLNNGGQSLSTEARNFYEPRFGYDFSNVKIHTDTVAAKSAQSINALAYTSGNDIVFNNGQYSPNTESGKKLLGHELTHVVQQKGGTGINNSGAFLQRSLILTGNQTNIDDFMAMSATASGLVLVRNPLTNIVTAVGSSATPATSPAFERRLTAIMNDPRQDAEIHVGRDQANVDIGAFPTPPDLTGNRFQNVDMDDINAMEAGAPGIGVADLLHEIVENFDAHSTPGVNSFARAHNEGLQAEAEVATDIVGSGRRVAQADEQVGTNVTNVAEDYDAYYVLSTITATPARNSFTRSNVSFAPKVLVGNHTANNFATGANVVPATGAADVAAAAADLAANPLATVRIEGFTDNVGTPASNLTLSGQRAEAASADLVAAGIDPNRIQTVARGATAFAAANDTEAHRALNRRVVLIVNRPGP